MKKHSSHKWISMEDAVSRRSNGTSGGRHLVTGNVEQVFNQVGRSECNIISVFGRARQGKSFLMNCLAGEKDIFRISNEKESCTQGIDISDKWLDLNEFSRIDGGRSSQMNNRNIKIGFVDAEGQGDKNVTYDATLVCPILLASKCVIFNWKGDLQKDHILETLGIMTKAAKNVAAETTSSSSSSSSVQQKSNAKFSHLHIVFRDWQATHSDCHDVYNMLFNFERNNDSETRDRIRSEVLQSFLTVRVWLFDAPTDSVQALKTKLTIDKTTFIFREQLRELRYELSNQLQEPTYFANQPLTGKTIPRLIHQVVDSLNRGETILPQSAFFNMMRVEVDNLRIHFEHEMRQCMLNCLHEVDFEKYGYQENVYILTEDEIITDRFHTKLATIKTRFEQESMSVIGEGGGNITNQVLKEANIQINRYTKELEDELKSSYRVIFNRWLIAARKHAETMIDTSMNELLISPTVYHPTPSESLNRQFQNIAKQAKNCIIKDTQYTKNATISTEMNDTIQLLQRHVDAWIIRILQANQEKIEKNQKICSSIMKQAVIEMEASIKKASIDLLQQSQYHHTGGYSRTQLEDSLNLLFEEKLNTLLSCASGTSYIDQIEHEFTESCKSLRRILLTTYAEDRYHAVEVIVNESFIALNDTMNQFIKQNLDINDVTSILKQYEDLVENIKQRAVNDTREWTMTDDMRRTEIYEPIDEKAKEYKSELVKVFNQRLELKQQQQKQQQQEAARLTAAAAEEAAKRERQQALADAAEQESLRMVHENNMRLERERNEALLRQQYEEDNPSMSVDDDDDEEEEDEIKENKTKGRSSSSSSSSSSISKSKLSKEEQISQANAWAASNGIKSKTGSKKRSSSSSSSSSSSLNANKESVVSVKAQMEQAKQWANNNQIVIDDDAPEEDEDYEQSMTTTNTKLKKTTPKPSTRTSGGGGVSGVSGSDTAATKNTRKSAPGSYTPSMNNIPTTNKSTSSRASTSNVTSSSSASASSLNKRKVIDDDADVISPTVTAAKRSKTAATVSSPIPVTTAPVTAKVVVDVVADAKASAAQARLDRKNAAVAAAAAGKGRK